MAVEQQDSKPPNLTDKQFVFCHEYLIDYNGTQAAIRAGYSQKGARQIASDTLAKAYIKDYVYSLIKKGWEEKFVNRERVLDQLYHQAFADPLDYYNDNFKLKKLEDMTREQRMAIHSIEVKEWTGGQDGRASSTEVKFKLYDKQKALDMIGRDLSMWKDNLTIDGKLEAPPPMAFNTKKGKPKKPAK